MANNQLIASDNFASGSLAAGWTSSGGTVQSAIVNRISQPTALSVSCGQWWGSVLWPTDQISEVTANLVTELSSQIVLSVRVNSALTSGYAALIKNGVAVLLLVNSNGSTTQLGPSANIISISGDVWTLQAAGIFISLYQNGKLVLSYYDGTWISGGAPGYTQFSSVDVTHAQVFSWRGYNSIQQDGIWQKQNLPPGLVPISVDLTGNPIGQGLQSIGMMRDTNPQILTSQTTVFKAWLLNGWASLTAAAVYYAESADGLTWTRQGAAVLNGFTNCSVFKDGSTYYMIGQTVAANGQGTFQIFTSSNGVNWVQQSPTQTISRGAGWDSGSIYPDAFLGKISGTFYFSYTGSVSGQFSTGLITSIDGINWVKANGGNPIITSTIGSRILTACVKVGSVYYAWVASSQNGMNPAGGSPFLDPIEGLRYTSTDLLNWTLSAHSIHHSQLYEGLNFGPGYCYAVSLIEVNGQTFMYTNTGYDNRNPDMGMIGLAIAPTTLASLVTQPEDALQQIATETFVGSGSLSASWATPVGSSALQLASGKVGPSATATVCAAARVAEVFNTDQYSEVTVSTMVGTSDFTNPAVRMSTLTSTWYGTEVHGPVGTNGNIQIYKFVSGVQTNIGPALPMTPLVGDVIRLAVTTGSDGFPILSVYQNGFLAAQVQDYGTPITSGRPGMVARAASVLANAQMSAWAAGNASVIPPYTSQISGNTGGLSGVTVSWAGPSSGSTVSGPGGAYTTPINLPIGSYSLTAGSGFSPSVITVVLSGPSITGVNFLLSGTFVEGLYSLLAADSGVQGILGLPTNRKEKTTGIFPNVAPDEVTLPYVVFTQVHRDPILSFQGVNRVHSLRFQLSCYGPSYKTAKSLAIQIKNLLDGFMGSLPNFVYVFHSSPISEHDETEPVFKGTVYGVILDYLFITNGA